MKLKHAFLAAALAVLPITMASSAVVVGVAVHPGRHCWNHHCYRYAWHGGYYDYYWHGRYWKTRWWCRHHHWCYR
jgi:hypothetical protein